MAQIQDITIFRGEDVALNFTVAPTTDITGWTITFNVKRRAEDASALLTVAGSITSAVAGTFSVALSATQTAALNSGRYVYDVWRTDNGSAAALALGALVIKGTVRLP